MYYTSELIPARFLILTAHFIICVLLLWNGQQNVKSCSIIETTQAIYNANHMLLVIGLSITIGMICFELFVFLIGLTMFHTTSALLSIGCHSSACFLLTCTVLDGWQCGWYLWIFIFGSIIPIIYDICILISILINKRKY